MSDSATLDSPEALRPIPLVKTEPWQHQTRAFNFARELWASGRQGVLLALGMGCGKSKVTVDLICNESIALTIIFCPKSVVDEWPRQVALHAALPLHVLTLGSGSTTDRRDLAKQFVNELANKSVEMGREQQGVIVTNYESIMAKPHSAFADWIASVDWGLVVCDEVHRITGTPLPHSPIDAFAEYRFLDKSIFGPFITAFRARYCVMDPRFPSRVIGWNNRDELTKNLQQIMIQARPDDVLKLPPAVHMERRVKLNASFASYDQMEHDFVVWLKGGEEVSASNVLVKLLRLQQITGGHIDKTRPEGWNEKKVALCEALEELPEDEPVVVFCRFHPDLDQVHEIAKELGRGSLELSGRSWGNGLTDWQEGGAPILACQIQSGSLGVNMTRARYAVYFSLGFSLAEYEQSLARLRRPGQQGESVVYIHLIAAGTVDEKVYAALRARKDVVESILGRSTNGSDGSESACTADASADSASDR
jgi:SNF2 family DNA or RNA helicase